MSVALPTHHSRLGVVVDAGCGESSRCTRCGDGDNTWVVPSIDRCMGGDVHVVVVAIDRVSCTALTALAVVRLCYGGQHGVGRRSLAFLGCSEVAV